MKKVENGYCENYYLTKDGRLYNSITKEYKRADKQNKFTLKTLGGERKKISLKVLYAKVYNKPYCEDNINDLEHEEWKEVDNTNGLYFVSNKGRIKSYKGYKAIIMTPYKTIGGYDRVDIIQDGMRVSKLIHRLVAFSFLPIRNNIDIELHHKDFDKTNNCSDNLEWLTKLEHLKKHRKGETECQTITATQTKEV